MGEYTAAMREKLAELDPRRVLVVMPTWLGDCVMATPTLAKLRERFASSHLTALIRSGVAPVLNPCPLLDERMLWTRGERMGALARRVRRERFDLAVVLPGSFRSALLMRLAGVPRRLGYRRDGRGWLLTDHLDPPREAGRLVPTPTLRYYLRLAGALGCNTDDAPSMRLWHTEEDDQQALSLLAAARIDLRDGPLVVLVPGGNKPAKRWAPERFAKLADHLTQRHGVQVAVSGSPEESDVLDAVIEKAGTRIGNLLTVGVELRLLKSVFAHASLVVTNDTGPRHVAAAMGIPVVSLFGPTPLRWTVLDCPHERTIIAPDSHDPAGNLRPEGGTMDAISLERVIEAADELLDRVFTPSPVAAQPR